MNINDFFVPFAYVHFILFFYFLKIFLDGIIFLKSLIEFVTIVLLFYDLFFWSRGMWDLGSLTRD